MPRTPTLLSAVAVMIFLAGCTVTKDGSATPESGTDSTSSESPTSGPGTSTVDVPPPPRDLSIDGLDPCTLFTEQQRAELQINKVKPDDGSTSGTIYKDMKQCTLDKDDAEPFISYDIVAVTNIDVSWWINEPHNADVALTSVGDYPAARFHIKGSGKYGCAIALGVAKNQHLHVEMLPLTDDITGDAICEGSEQAAAMALQTLQTMR